jgi:hypothetical protein
VFPPSRVDFDFHLERFDSNDGSRINLRRHNRLENGAAPQPPEDIRSAPGEATIQIETQYLKARGSGKLITYQLRRDVMQSFLRRERRDFM